MLLNVTNDDRFQAYLDGEEGKLIRALVPILATGIRLQVTYNQVQAQAYVDAHGASVLLSAYRRIYGDQWAALGKAEVKADRLLRTRNPRASRVSATAPGRARFVDRQQIYLQRRAATQIRNISTSLSQDIAGTILGLAEEGRPVREIAGAIMEDAVELSKTRALTIARTEVHNSAMAAVFAGMEDRDIQPRTKTWWTAGDDRVRPSHAELHGEEIDYDDTFANGLAYPGDWSGSADEVVNCRCSCLYSTE